MITRAVWAGLRTASSRTGKTHPKGHMWLAFQSCFRGELPGNIGTEILRKAQTFPEECSGLAILVIWIAGTNEPGALPVKVAIHCQDGHFCAQPALGEGHLVATLRTFLGQSYSLWYWSAPEPAIYSWPLCFELCFYIHCYILTFEQWEA